MRRQIIPILEFANCYFYIEDIGRMLVIFLGKYLEIDYIIVTLVANNWKSCWRSLGFKFPM